jgi:RNA polymerase sigma-70 factor (ECF subfamily)
MLEADRLIDQATELDSDAFMDAVDAVIPAAYRLAHGMLRNRDEAADMVQEATLNAWRNRSSFREGSPMRPWFLAIVANECRQAVRSRWWSVIRQADVEVGATHAGEGHSDQAETLRAALLQLNHRDRLVLVLRYYMDLSFSEIGDTLRISGTAARVRTHRALARLKPIIDIPEDLPNE